MFDTIVKFFAKQKVLIIVSGLTIGIFGAGYVIRSFLPNSKDLDTPEQIIKKANSYGLSEHFEQLFKDEELLFTSNFFHLF